MDNREEEIRVRAYEIWERQGRSGNPEDHWLEAERELKTEEAPPVESVEALEAASDSPAKRKRSPRASKG